MTLAQDGIGIEVYSGNDMLLEVFRDDTKKTREVTQVVDSQPQVGWDEFALRAIHGRKYSSSKKTQQKYWSMSSESSNLVFKEIISKGCRRELYGGFEH